MATTTTSIHPVGETGTDVRTLDRLVQHADRIDGVWIDDVSTGDWVMVRTRNSTYSLAPLGQGRYRVTGGWFASFQVPFPAALRVMITYPCDAQL